MQRAVDLLAPPGEAPVAPPPWVVGALVGGAGTALLLAGPARAAAGRSWPAFVLVLGLLLLGRLAHAEGLFDVAAAALTRRTSHPLGLFALGCCLVVAVTTLLSLDTAVVFLTPVLVGAAQRAGADPEPLLYACVFGANAGSLLLPGANLTNLILLGGHAPPALEAARTLWPAAVATPVAALAVLAVLEHRRLRHEAPPAPVPDAPRARGRLGLVGTAAATVVILVVGSPAPVVLAIALLTTLAAVRAGTLSARSLGSAAQLPSLLSLFCGTVLVGAAGALVAPPEALLAHAGAWGAAGLGALSAVAMNNLPATAWLAGGHVAHPAATLVGLNAGPNLAVTGSLSALLWFNAARAAGVRPSAVRFSSLGLLVAPAGIAAGVLALG